MWPLMRIATALICVLALVGGSLATALPLAAQGENLLANGGFEGAGGWVADSWAAAATFARDTSEAHSGSGSGRITIDPAHPDDARWVQQVAVMPNTTYILSGWIKTAGVAPTSDSNDIGANLSLMGGWTRTEGLRGDHGWTYVSLSFTTDAAQQEVTVAARLGFYGGTTSGTAWFDDLRLRPIRASDPHPNWKILVLIYGDIDFRTSDPLGIEHHYVGALTDGEIAQISQQARLFVEQDIPALNSGNMLPTVTIRQGAPLTELTPIGAGWWWPAPWNITADRDPAFDSVIVVWNTYAVDQTNGQSVNLGGGYAGLALDMGTGQTYFSAVSDSALHYGHRNVFKHEWGHSLASYFDATGTAPKPAVDNHQPQQYVNCQTGQPYLFIDESEADPIPNSIYNNQSGFTHDFYSGQTALATAPSRCLGITPAAWAAGGPVSKPSDLASNLLANGGFEEADEEGQPAIWSENISFTRSDTLVHSGQYAGMHRSARNRSYTVRQKLTDLDATTTYQFNGWVNIPQTRDLFKLRISIRWRDDDGHTLGTVTVGRFTRPTDGWSEVTATLTPPPGTTRAEVQMKVSSLKGPIYVDDFAFAALPGATDLGRMRSTVPVP